MVDQSFQVPFIFRDEEIDAMAPGYVSFKIKYSIPKENLERYEPNKNGRGERAALIKG